MKKTISKILDIPIQYTLGIGAVILIMVAIAAQGQMTLLSGVVVISLAVVVGLQIHFGSIIIKGIIAGIGILYAISIYTNTVMTIQGNVIEPFLLTLASTLIFLAVTYSPKHLNNGIRSRIMWSTVITIIISSVKMALIISGYSFLITEVVGMNVLAIMIAAWIIWLHNAKKTKVIYPIINKEETIDNFKFIYIDNQLDAVNNIWIGSHFDKDNNAYPFIYSETLRAKEEGLSLVLVSLVKTSELYDVGKIKVNRPKELLYLYMEAKENYYAKDIMKDFVRELSR